MTKFNVIQKKRRAQTAERKRELFGHPLTGKLTEKPQFVPISGKRKRKLFKKWRRDQKEALAKGLITMEDVEMAVAEGPSKDKSSKTLSKLHMKKSAKVQVKMLKGKGKDRKKSTSSKPASSMEVSEVDTMVE
ncbi:hypothetical protein MKW98_030919 [Papaver atlanticum]|uniref:Uncharacterized protein n=1 Tax=Papaver atlanticum TaxID=357466 RepID=A0AAD4S6M0_9MAGN|nr:hypothetical protein MKW98_030919 [Papaver atlanticum]